MLLDFGVAGEITMSGLALVDMAENLKLPYGGYANLFLQEKTDLTNLLYCYLHFEWLFEI